MHFWSLWPQETSMDLFTLDLQKYGTSTCRHGQTSLGLDFVVMHKNKKNAPVTLNGLKTCSNSWPRCHIRLTWWFTMHCHWVQKIHRISKHWDNCQGHNHYEGLWLLGCSGRTRIISYNHSRHLDTHTHTQYFQKDETTIQCIHPKTSFDIDHSHLQGKYIGWALLCQVPCQWNDWAGYPWRPRHLVFVGCERPMQQQARTLGGKTCWLGESTVNEIEILKASCRPCPSGFEKTCEVSPWSCCWEHCNADLEILLIQEPHKFGVNLFWGHSQTPWMSIKCLVGNPQAMFLCSESRDPEGGAIEQQQKTHDWPNTSGWSHPCTSWAHRKHTAANSLNCLMSHARYTSHAAQHPKTRLAVGVVYKAAMPSTDQLPVISQWISPVSWLEQLSRPCSWVQMKWQND